MHKTMVTVGRGGEMKIVITWLHRNGKSRNWTNATPEEHTAMCLAAYSDAIKRLAKKWNMKPTEAIDRINDIIKISKGTDK